MEYAALLKAGWLISSHALAAILAFFLGLAQFVAPKGTLPHKTLGYTWSALMFWVATSSFFIYDIRMWGPFSPIHILSLFVMYGLVSGIREARRKDVKEHRKTMVLLFSGALLIAGVLAFMPGRLMHKVIFGG
ncbi:MAG: DUF2306 domain-containing protein [Roseibium sp.]